jgi:hypothetical protein
LGQPEPAIDWPNQQNPTVTAHVPAAKISLDFSEVLQLLILQKKPAKNLVTKRGFW